jgi:hypothetical protein
VAAHDFRLAAQRLGFEPRNRLLDFPLQDIDLLSETVNLPAGIASRTARPR